MPAAAARTDVIPDQPAVAEPTDVRRAEPVVESTAKGLARFGKKWNVIGMTNPVPDRDQEIGRHQEQGLIRVLVPHRGLPPGDPVRGREMVSRMVCARHMAK